MLDSWAFKLICIILTIGIFVSIGITIGFICL